MKTLWTWVKAKVGWVFVGIASLIGLITVVSLKTVNPYKPAFYLFSGYLDEQSKKDIDQKYTVKEYGDVNEFDFAIANQKATAGITSDYLIVNLINEGKIAPLSMEMRELNGEKNDKNEVVKPLSKQDYLGYFTDEAVTQMNFFDKFITPETQARLRKDYPEYGTNYSFTFSDFVIPYFMNDQVYAFDTNKILGETYAKGEEINPLGFKTDKQNIPWAETVTEAMKTIVDAAKEHGNIPKIQWVKNEIENSFLGSEYDDHEKFDTALTEDNYLTNLENFSKIVQEATGASMSNNSVNLFETDSDGILNNLINPDNRINIATLYNGDALDAYWGSDNYEGKMEDGDRLRFVRTKNSIQILDAFVVSSDVDADTRKELLEYFNYWMFNYVFKTKEELIEIRDALEVLPETERKYSFYELPGMLRIFDFVNYTVSAKGIYDFLVEDYFVIEEEEEEAKTKADGDAGDEEEPAPVIDQIALNIFKLSPNAKPISPVDKELTSKLTTAFQRKING